IKSTPISSSRSVICRLRAGCATRSRADAFVKFNASATATKYRRCRSSIALAHYAEKAWLRKLHSIGRIEGDAGVWRQMVTETTQTEKRTNENAYENPNNYRSQSPRADLHRVRLEHVSA